MVWLSLLCRRTTRDGVGGLSLLASQQEVTKKCAKGPNALWIPATRHEKSQIFLIVARSVASSAFASAAERKPRSWK